MIGEIGETWTLDVWTKWRKRGFDVMNHIVPSFSAVTMVGDDRAHKPIARLYEATWLGVVVWATRPTSVDRNARSFP